eukprot:COSAG01_NODE_26681_length_706_cov_0.924217_1_plen_27_part_10
MVTGVEEMLSTRLSYYKESTLSDNIWW